MSQAHTYFYRFLTFTAVVCSHNFHTPNRWKHAKRQCVSLSYAKNESYSGRYISHQSIYACLICFNMYYIFIPPFSYVVALFTTPKKENILHTGHHIDFGTQSFAAVTFTMLQIFVARQRKKSECPKQAFQTLLSLSFIQWELLVRRCYVCMLFFLK